MICLPYAGFFFHGTLVDLPGTMVDLLGTLVDLPRTIVDLPGTMVDLPGTMVDLPGTMIDLPGTMVDLPGTIVDLTGIMVDLSETMVNSFGPMVDLYITMVDLSGTMIDLPGTLVDLSGILVDLFWKLLAQQLSSFYNFAAQHLSSSAPQQHGNLAGQKLTKKKGAAAQQLSSPVALSRKDSRKETIAQHLSRTGDRYCLILTDSVSLVFFYSVPNVIWLRVRTRAQAPLLPSRQQGRLLRGCSQRSHGGEAGRQDPHREGRARDLREGGQVHV